MTCDFCGSENPEISIEQVTGKRKKYIHICRKCANERGLVRDDDSIEFSLSKLVNFYLGNENSDGTLVCRKCGTNLSEIKKTRKLGCEDCAIEFRKYIYRVLNSGRHHGKKLLYSGKIPARMKIVKDVFIDLEILKNQLENAVNKEEYERAAAIRDKIRNIGLRSKT